MVNYFYLFLYKVLSKILQVIPRSWSIALSKWLAQFVYFLSKKYQKIIGANLDLAFEKKLTPQEKKEIGIATFRNLIDTVFGVMQRDCMPKEIVLQNIKFEGEEIIREYQNKNKQFILITGHQGNWELLSQAVAIYFDFTLVGVGRKLNSQVMDLVLKKNRERFNVEMVYKKGAIKSCIQAILQKKIVGILIDQHLPLEQSINVDFFNHKVTHTPMASILSRKFDLDLIPVFISTEDYKNYVVNVYNPIKAIKTDDKEKDLEQMTLAQASVMERAVRAHPKEWFWVHKRWKEFYKYIYE